MTNINLTTTSFTPSTAPPTILFNSPFQKPSDPDFKMNYMSLDPEHMKTYIFTSPTTFENIGE
jgi:hypothetical protein